MTDKSVADDVMGRFARQQHDWFERVRKGSLDPQAVAKAVQGVIDQGSVLKLISGDERLVIGPTDGSELLAEATDVFAYIDPDFRNWGADEPGQSTEQAPVCVYEMAKDATFAQMFGSLALDAGKICLTQAQIKGFVSKHRQWLRSDGYAIFFLFRSHDQFFVARVGVCSDGKLGVNVSRFVDSNFWLAEDRRRLVVPQLA